MVVVNGQRVLLASAMNKVQYELVNSCRGKSSQEREQIRRAVNS